MDKALDQQIQSRAANRCEYCRIEQSVYRARFQIDHVIALQHGALIQTENLALSCIRCNCHKGPNIAGIDPASGVMTRLFHPRRDEWHAHFSWKIALLVGRTAEGRTTIELLAINDPEYIDLRKELMMDGSF